MKRLIISTCTAMAFAVGLAAQTPAPAGQPAKPDQSAPSAAADKSVTLKGCLKAGATPDSFELADAAPVSETAGTSGAASAIKGQTVRLIGSPAGTNLKEHVGHMVEATGMITPAAKSSAPAGAPPAGGAAPPAGASASDTARLNVKAVKHLETKCS